MKKGILTAGLLAWTLLSFCAESPLPEFLFHPGFDQTRMLRQGNVRYSFGKDFCRAENRAPSRYAHVVCKLDMPFRPDLKVDFDYRCSCSEKVYIESVRAQLRCGEKEFLKSFPAGREWKHGTFLAAPYQGRIPSADAKCTAFVIYSRIAPANPEAVCALEVRNVRFSADPAYRAGNNTPDRRQLKGLEKNFYKTKDAELAVKDGALEVTTLPNRRKVKAQIKLDIPAKPDSFLVFEYRNVGPKLAVFRHNIMYIIITGAPAIERRFSNSDGAWHRAAIPLGRPGDEGKTVRHLTVFAELSINQVTVPHAGIAVRNMHVEKNPAYCAAEALPPAVSAIPHFDWRRPKPGERFTVTLTSGQKKLQWTISRNWFAPPEPLANGIWECRVTSGKNMVFSSRFRVTDLSHRWKAPEIDAVKLAKMTSPKLKALGEYWYPDSTKVYQEADLALQFQTQDNPPAYDPKDPRFHSWNDYHRLINGPVATVGHKLTWLGVAFNRSGKAAYADKAKEILLKVAGTWDLNGGSSIHAGDLRTARLLIGMCFAYDAVDRRLTAAERNVIRQNIRDRAEQFWHNMNPNGSGDGNHRWNQVSACTFATLTLGEKFERFEDAVSLYAYRFLPRLGLDGESQEGLKYWSFGFKLAMDFLDLARIVGGVDLYQQPWVRKTARFPLYSQPTAGYSISFADNGSPNHCGGPLHRDMIARLADNTGDPAARFFAGYPAAGPVRLPIDIPQSRCFRRIGVSIFNTFLPDARENVQLGFHSGPYFGTHQHADQNSFVINAYGDKLAVDGGYYDSTDTPHFFYYSIATAAHNTILVDGKGQTQHTTDADGKTTGYLDLPDFGYVSGDAANEHVYNGLLNRFSRQIVFIKPDYVIVYDDLASQKPSSFRFLLHAQQEKGLIPVFGNRAFSILRPKSELHGEFLLPDKLKLESKAADYVVHPKLWDSYELNPDVVAEQVLTASNAAPANQTEFLVPMQITKKAGTRIRWSKLETADAVAALTSDAMIAFSRKPGKMVRIGKLEFNGPAAAVRLERGNAVSGMKRPGELLRWNGIDVPVRMKEEIAHTKESLRLNNTEIAADRYTKKIAGNRKIECVSMVIPAQKNHLLTIRTEKADTDCNYILSSPSAQSCGILPARTAAGTVLTMGEPAILTVTGTSAIGKIALSAKPFAETDAVAEAKTFRPSADSVLVEAETREHGPAVPGTVYRKCASGGTITNSWSPGSTGTWRFQVLKNSKYLLRFRMANGKMNPVRSIRIDRQDPILFRSGPTNGFGRYAAEWRWFRVPQPVTLAAGEHTLEMTAVSGEGNLDCISLTSSGK